MHVYSNPVPHGMKASKEIRVNRDSNLWRLTQPQWEWLKTLYEVLHEVHTIKLRDHRFDAEIIIVSD